MIHLDTHVALWLHLNQVRRLTKAAVVALRTNDLMISPLVVVEIEILAETGKVDVDVDKMLRLLKADFDIRLSSASMEQVMTEARRFAWTRDPFDRLIVANAMADGAKLITADMRIGAHFDGAVW